MANEPDMRAAEVSADEFLSGEPPSKGKRSGGGGNITTGDFRPEVILPGNGKEGGLFAEELGKRLREKSIFNRGGVVMELDGERKELNAMDATRFRYWSEQHVGYVGWAGRGDGKYLERTTITEETCRAVLASPQFLRALRPLERVHEVRQPVLRPDNKLELLPIGYDEQYGVWTWGLVEFDEALPLMEAVKVLKGWMEEFPWPEDSADLCRAVVYASMLGVFCDTLLDSMDQRPMFIYTANAPGSGKTLLARLAIAPVFGPVKITPPPDKKGGDEIMKSLLAIAQAGDPYVLFDNWRGIVQNTALEGFVTANVFGGRILGTPKNFKVKKQCLVFITGNDAIVNEDNRRRSLFVELFMKEARAEDRKITNEFAEKHILARRGEILAALWALVRHWDAKDRPRASKTHGSFPEWGHVIGGMVEAAGGVCPLERVKLMSGGDTVLDEFDALVASAGAFKDHWEPHELLGRARSMGLFAWFLSDSEPTADKEARYERAKFASICHKFRGRLMPSGYSFSSQGDGHSRFYLLTK
jgi:hypothetical protein